MRVNKRKYKILLRNQDFNSIYNKLNFDQKGHLTFECLKKKLNLDTFFRSIPIKPRVGKLFDFIIQRKTKTFVLSTFKHNLFREYQFNN